MVVKTMPGSDVYRVYNPVTSKVVETRDIHDLADKTNATNDIRLTVSEIYDPELILEEPEPAEVIEEPDEDSPPVHLIPHMKMNWQNPQQNLDFPLPGAARIHDEEKKSFEEKGSRIEQNNSFENEEDHEDESNSTQTDDSDDDDLAELHTRPKASEMETYGADDDAVETGEQADRPQRNSTRLKNEMKRLGIEVPIMIEDYEIGIKTRSKTDQVAFNETPVSDPGEPKTFRKAMNGKNRDKY